MVYIDKNDLIEIVFPFIEKRYGQREEVPDYCNERNGMSQLIGVLERVQDDAFYPTLLQKASYLLISVNKGHFFSNGNKRLALLVTIAFLIFNSHRFKRVSKDTYKALLLKYFKETEKIWEDFDDFSSTDYAAYNLSISIADSGASNINHENLKERVLTFLTESIEQYEQDED